MASIEEFLTAIASEKSAISSRLVFADWLDEQGDPWGHFIRLDAQLRKIDNEDPFFSSHFALGEYRRLSKELANLLKAKSSRWIEACGFRESDGVRFTFKNGLVWRVTTSDQLLLANEEDIFNSRYGALISELELRTSDFYSLASPEILGRILDREWFRGIDHLKIDSCASNANVRELCRHESFGHLHSLDLQWRGQYSIKEERAQSDQLLTSEVLQTIANSSVPNRLADLRIGSQTVSDVGAAIISKSAAFSQLETLDLSDNEITVAGVRELANSPVLQHLKCLSLSNNTLTDDALKALSETDALADLRIIDLSYNRLKGNIKSNIKQRSSGLSWVSLYLRKNRLDHRILQFLSSLVEANCIKALDLARNHIDGAFLGTLFDSEVCGALEYLSLNDNPIGDVGASTIANSKYATRVKHLSLANAKVGSAGVIALANSDNLSRIETLNLAQIRMSEDAAVAILESQVLPQTFCLTIHRNGLTDGVIQRFTKRFGDLVCFT